MEQQQQNWDCYIFLIIIAAILVAINLACLLRDIVIWIFKMFNTTRALLTLTRVPSSPSLPGPLKPGKSEQLSFVTLITIATIIIIVDTGVINVTMGSSDGSYFVYRRDPFGMHAQVPISFLTCIIYIFSRTNKNVPLGQLAHGRILHSFACTCGERMLDR